LSLTIGPPKVVLICWSEYGSTRFTTKSSALKLSSRKKPDTLPA
jgi:hypothetical protein